MWIGTWYTVYKDFDKLEVLQMDIVNFRNLLLGKFDKIDVCTLGCGVSI